MNMVMIFKAHKINKMRNAELHSAIAMVEEETVNEIVNRQLLKNCKIRYDDRQFHLASHKAIITTKIENTAKSPSNSLVGTEKHIKELFS